MSCSNLAAMNLPVCSAGLLPPIRACVYFSNSSSAVETAARWASVTRSSPPTSAVRETDLGAENVASQPARCSTGLVTDPSGLVYSFPSRCCTICSSVCGCSALGQTGELQWRNLHRRGRKKRQVFPAIPLSLCRLVCSNSARRSCTRACGTSAPGRGLIALEMVSMGAYRL